MRVVAPASSQATVQGLHSFQGQPQLLNAPSRFPCSNSYCRRRCGVMHLLRSCALQCEARIRRFPRPIPGTASSKSRRHKSVHHRISRTAHPKLHPRALPRGKSGLDTSSSKPQTDVYNWKQRLPGDSGWDIFKLSKTDTKTFNRFREIEVIHARWAMLGVISLLLGDISGSPFPPKQWDVASVAPWGVVLLLALALFETYRIASLWGEEDVDKRVYPGKRFDVLGLASRTRQQPEEPPPMAVFASWLGGVPGWLAGGWWFNRREMTEAELLEMKSRELRNGRLAMVSFVGCCMASAMTGKGPITLLMQHLADPVHNTIVQTLQ